MQRAEDIANSIAEVVDLRPSHFYRRAVKKGPEIIVQQDITSDGVNALIHATNATEIAARITDVRPHRGGMVVAAEARIKTPTKCVISSATVDSAEFGRDDKRRVYLGQIAIHRAKRDAICTMMGLTKDVIGILVEKVLGKMDMTAQPVVEQHQGATIPEEILAGIGEDEW